MKLLATVNSVLAVLLFAGLTIIVALQVLTRFVLHVPFIWSEELARFLCFMSRGGAREGLLLR